MTTEEIKQNKILRSWTYLARFFLSLSFGFSLYISSSFLASFLDESYVGIIFSIAALMSIMITFYIPALLAKYGNVRLMAAFGLLSVLIVPLLVTSTSAPLVVSLFMVFYIITLTIRYQLDLYLEHLSDHKIAGEIRGIFTVLSNGPLIFAVMTISLLLGETNDYWKVFTAGALALLPFVFIASTKLKEERAKYKTLPVFDTLKNIFWARDDYDKKLHQILAIDFLLNFFYVVMVIYTPIYLLNNIGFSWDHIGLMFTLMILPFIIIPFPLGFLADKKIGEKEMLSLGLLIMGLATIAMSFVAGASFWLWAILLITTRIGASIVESMKESYLFKTVTPGDVSILSISRNTVPLAYIIAPFFTSAFLAFFDFKFLFAFVGLSMIFGLRYSLVLVDTK